MAARDLQTLNLKFDQVIFNRNFEVTFGIFSVLVTQINILEDYLNKLIGFGFFVIFSILKSEVYGVNWRQFYNKVVNK